jgi:hypothetical protein
LTKTPTAWITNPTKNVNVPLYSSAAVLYSSALVSYSSPTVGQNELNKPSTLWTKITKTPSSWLVNPLFAANQYAYDSATFTYDDAVQNYDGITQGQSSVSTKPPTSWTQVG